MHLLLLGLKIPTDEVYGTYAYDNKTIKFKERSNKEHESEKNPKKQKAKQIKIKDSTRCTKLLDTVIIELPYLMCLNKNSTQSMSTEERFKMNRQIWKDSNRNWRIIITILLLIWNIVINNKYTKAKA